MDEEEATELTTTNTKGGGDGDNGDNKTTKGNNYEETKTSDEALKPSNIDSPSDVASQTSVLSSDVDDVFEEPQTPFQRMRKFVRLDIVQTSWFETVILIVIIINCVFLALDNPTNTNETLKEFSINY